MAHHMLKRSNVKAPQAVQWVGGCLRTLPRAYGTTDGDGPSRSLPTLTLLSGACPFSTHDLTGKHKIAQEYWEEGTAHCKIPKDDRKARRAKGGTRIWRHHQGKPWGLRRVYSRSMRGRKEEPVLSLTSSHFTLPQPVKWIPLNLFQRRGKWGSEREWFGKERTVNNGRAESLNPVRSPFEDTVSSVWSTVNVILLYFLPLRLTAYELG